MRGRAAIYAGDLRPLYRNNLCSCPRITSASRLWQTVKCAATPVTKLLLMPTYCEPRSLLFHASFHGPTLGLASLFLFYLVCPHLPLFALYVLLFRRHHTVEPFQSFFCNFLGRLHHSWCPYRLLIYCIIIIIYSYRPV